MSPQKLSLLALLLPIAYGTAACVQQPPENLAPAAQKVQSPSWYGFQPDKFELPLTILLCYVAGYQLRTSTGLPALKSVVGSLAADIALGTAANLWTTICHEAGHVLGHRLCFGSWPAAVKFGSSDPEDRPLFAFFNGKIMICGLNPLGGFTYFPDTTDLTKIGAIPFLAAGSLCGACGYLALAHGIGTIWPPKDGGNIWLHLPFLQQAYNITFHAIEPESEANRIVNIIISHLAHLFTRTG